MADPRLLDLLDEALESGRTAEDVCSDCPELVTELQSRLQKYRGFERQLDALFPTSHPPVQSLGGKSDWEPALPSIPGYEVRSVLGRGGMGIVYLAMDLQLRRPVALKMLLAGAFAGGVERLRFLREARAIAALHHPHIVQVHDVGEFEGRPFFTMEYLEGGTLAAKLGGVPLPGAEAARLLGLLADAVAAAHAGNVLHRDLKPSNVLLSLDGTPKVSDFGLAGKVDAGEVGEEDSLLLTLSGARIGTPSYMAPEQVSFKRGAIGRGSDIYALGAVLYDLLTGRPPFRGESAAETERQLLADDPVPPSRLNPRVPRDLETICLKCLSKDANRRYVTANALADDLSLYRSGMPIKARRVGRAERGIKWARRRPALAGLWTVSLAAAAAALWLLSDRAAALRAVDAELTEAVFRQRAAQWNEAASAIDRAAFRLGNRWSGELRGRLEQAIHDKELAQKLDAIAIKKISAASPATLFTVARGEYGEAFRQAGLGAVGDPPAAVGARIARSNVRSIIVPAIYDWMRCHPTESEHHWLVEVASVAEPDPSGWRRRACASAFLDNREQVALLAADPHAVGQPLPLLLTVSDHMTLCGLDPTPFLLKVGRARLADFWINYELGRKMANKDLAESLRYYQAALALRPNLAIVHLHIGNALARAKRTDEAIAEIQTALEMDPLIRFGRKNLSIALRNAGRSAEDIKQLEEGLRLSPNDGELSLMLAGALLEHGEAERAVTMYRSVVAADPRNGAAHRGVRDALTGLGRHAELPAAWRAMVKADPPDHDAWNVYAEYCLYAGDDAGYQEVVRQLLNRFGSSKDPTVCERTGRACLLAQPTPADLATATAAIDRALESQKERKTQFFPYFRFAKGLAEYRAGNFESAITIMEGDAANVLYSGPQLVVSMARAKLGKLEEAKHILANACLSTDWGPSFLNTSDAFMLHVLRREAQKLVLPNLPAYLDGKYEPTDPAECLAMLGECEDRHRWRAVAQLWARASASDPRFASGGRQMAVRVAALAGCGFDSEAPALSDAERTEWRSKSRQWIYEEVRAIDHALDAGQVVGPAFIDELRGWATHSDLAGVREPAALAHLPRDEQAAWESQWDELRRVLARAQQKR